MIYLGNISDISIYYSKIIFSDISILPIIYRIYRIYRYITRYISNMIYRNISFHDISRYIARYCLSGQNIPDSSDFLKTIYNKVLRGLWWILSAEIFFLRFFPENRKNLGSPPPT